VSRPNPVVNLRIAGRRVITPDGVRGSQRGDNFSQSWDGRPPLKQWNVWLPNGLQPYIDMLADEDSAVWPEVTIEIVTDQSVDAGRRTRGSSDAGNAELALRANAAFLNRGLDSPHPGQ